MRELVSGVGQVNKADAPDTADNIHPSSEFTLLLKKKREINIFIHQGYLQLIKSDSQTFNFITKDVYFNKCCSLEYSIYQKILQKNKINKKMQKNIKQNNCISY